MPRLWILLLLVICTISSGNAVAQAHTGHRCDTNQIREQLESTGQVPNLKGCRPDEIRLMLQNYDYGLTIEKSIASRTIREGRIVSQRVQSSNVYVDLSTGPGPRDEQRRRDSDLLVDVLEGVTRIISNVPPPNPRPPVSEPNREPPPPAPEELIRVMTLPPRAVPAAPPPPPAAVQPTPTPSPTAVQPTPPPPPRAPIPANLVPKAEVKITQVSDPPPEQAPAPQATDPAPAPTTDSRSLQTDANVSPPAGQQAQKSTDVPLPPVSRFFIQGSSSAKEGDELLLTIRRDGRDGFNHRLELSYSDGSLLISPPLTFEFSAGLPDEVALRLRTAVAEGDGDRHLVVRLASANRAEVGQPDSVTAVILDRTPWWKKLLQAVASLPDWAVALAAAAAAATVALIFMPRATCSIGRGSVDLGVLPLKSRWPAVRANTVIGDASYSVPFPLPIGRRRDAEPSSA